LLLFFRVTRSAKSDNFSALHGSSKPGKRSFGRFSRPLLEVLFQIPCRYESKVKSLAVAEIFRYCKGFRLSYSSFCWLDQKYKRGLISEILNQKIRITHEDEKWEEVSLSAVADGFEYGMNAAATIFDGVHKYIRITDIDDDSHTYIDSAPVSPAGVLEGKYRVRENDILFARTGASVGKSYLYQASDGDMYFAGFLIRIHVIDGVDSGYVFLNTLTEEYNRWVALESTRSGQPGINAEQYRRYRFKLPPLETQKQISAIAQKIDAQIKRESQCLRLLQKQKDGFLQQLFI
jgi:type I restriction enzyme S subunit